MKKKSWYPTENGKSVIEVKLDNLEQLFDKRDPNPFRTRDLDDDVVEYITSSAHEIGKRKIGKLKIISNDNPDDQKRSVVESAVREYFEYRSDIAGKVLRTTLKLGLKTLFIGLIFLASAIFMTSILGEYFNNPYIKTFFKEGFLLVGWVSMWKPINIFLYEWWPLADDIKYYDVLSEIHVEVCFKDIENERRLGEI